MILKITLNDNDYTNKLVYPCKQLAKAIHRQGFIMKDDRDFLISDYKEFEDNLLRISTILKRSYEDNGKEDKLWFVQKVGETVLYYLHNSDSKNMDFYLQNLVVSVCETYVDTNENDQNIYLFIFDKDVTTSTFMVRQ